jgi:hypothetical protein
LFFASTTDGFSFTKNFLYRYFPTMIIVLYGMAFSWIGLDIKRLEPWFQLARNRGAETEKSVLLQYPSRLLAFCAFQGSKAPVSDAPIFDKQETDNLLASQWALVSAATIMVFASWGLQNGIFSNGCNRRAKRSSG